MMAELTSTVGLHHDGSTPYYSQANIQVEAVNKVLVTMLQRTIGMHKSNWYLMIFFSSMGLLNLDQRRNWIHTFPACLWSRSKFTD